MKIKASIERIPGGMMIIPLLLGAVINTVFPRRRRRLVRLQARF